MPPLPGRGASQVKIADRCVQMWRQEDSPAVPPFPVRALQQPASSLLLRDGSPQSHMEQVTLGFGPVCVTSGMFSHCSARASQQTQVGRKPPWGMGAEGRVGGARAGAATVQAEGLSNGTVTCLAGGQCLSQSSE